MSILGKTIRIFLADGLPTGVITAEIMNWTGHVLSAPRSSIVEVLKRREANRTGIYFLVGQDPNNIGQAIVYVGESDNVGDRLAQHNKDESKNFWETTCIVTNKDANLTKAHAKYLESRLIHLTKKAGRAELQNGNSPDYSYLPESDKSDMEYIIEQLQTLLPVLGFDFLRQTPQLKRTSENSDANNSSEGVRPSSDQDWQNRRNFGQDRPTIHGSDSPLFYFSDAQGTIRANAMEIDGEMIVMEGSEAREQEAPSLSSNVRLIRQQLKQSGKLVPSGKPGVLKFAEDVAFSSPSAASQAVMATSRNGRTDWRTTDTGQTYAVWQESQIENILKEIGIAEERAR